MRSRARLPAIGRASWRPRLASDQLEIDAGKRHHTGKGGQRKGRTVSEITGAHEGLVGVDGKRFGGVRRSAFGKHVDGIEDAERIERAKDERHRKRRSEQG